MFNYMETSIGFITFRIKSLVLITKIFMFTMKLQNKSEIIH